MTMMQKMQAKKSKKGFTLVELVIVIAILAILAAIAIPVITTTINSSKMSTLESDCTTIDMILKEAVNTAAASITTTKYGTGNVTAAAATVSDVFVTNNLSLDLLSARTIGGSTYQIMWAKNEASIVSGAAGGTPTAPANGCALAGATTIADLASYAGHKVTAPATPTT